MCVRERESVGKGAAGAHPSFTVYLEHRHNSFVKCKFSASMEKNLPFPKGVTALSAAKISGRGFYFEVG